MFVRDLFEYDEKEHKGYYCGKLVPSITQLLEVIYPLEGNIPTRNLKVAADRGTELHTLIEKFNNEPFDKAFLNPDIVNYFAFLRTCHLQPHRQEELVFLVDENKELIAYGHFDFVLRCEQENMFGEENDFVLGDLKTTAEIYKSKVRLQTELYRIAYQQTFIEKLSKTTFVLHLREGKIKWVPFTTSEEEKTILVAKELKEMWKNDGQH